MKTHYSVVFKTHKDIVPTTDEIAEALANLVHKKIAAANAEEDRARSTFELDVITDLVKRN